MLLPRGGRPYMTDRLVAGNVLPDRHAAADGAVEHLRRLLDAVGGGVERGGHRVLRRPGAVGGCGANAAQGLEFLLEAVDAMAGVDQFIARRQRRHHGQARVADLAELAAQVSDPRFQALGEPEQPPLLSLFAGHAILPAVDGDVDMAHEVSPASSTARMVPIAASSRAATSRLARSSLRDFTSDPSSSSASRERSAPSAWIRLANSFSSRSASRRRSTALSSASSAVINRRVAASMSTVAGSGGPEPLAGRSLMKAAHTLTWAGRTAKPAVRQAFRQRNLRGKR